ncbi:MAG: alpha/beta hydrolase [Erythrobacter sp.]|nr:alpha/beta hydrolase [Erythrobacter sp.]
MGFVFRTLVFVATVYMALFVVLWAFQSRFIYPAPQAVAPVTPGFEEVQLETSDGLSLRAFFREASDTLPTVVYFHGNGGTLEQASISNVGLIQAGLGALLVEYRGYGGNPGDPSEDGFYRDGEAAMAWLAAQGVSHDDTILIGNSIGSGVATEMATRHDAAALVLVAPFTSLPDAAQSNVWWLPAKMLVRDQYRNADKIADLDMPILIQHGDADMLIPFEHGRALSRLSENALFQPFEGSGHSLTFEPDSQRARRDWILALETERRR